MDPDTSCPHEFKRKVGSNTYTQVPLSGSITEIPMYHDCQRLLVVSPPAVTVGGRRVIGKFQRPASYTIDRGASYSFGPLVGLYVSERLGSFEIDAAGPVPPISVPTADSILGVTGAYIPGVAVTDTEPRGIAVIQFYNHGPGTYPALGIGANFTCLYLKSDRSAAYAVNTDTFPRCPLTSWGDLERLARADALRRAYGQGASYARVTPLAVNTSSPSPDSRDYVDVGRFDWDYQLRRHYVTIRCGATTWCEIGQTLPVSSPTNLAGTPAKLWQIKGWHDEQRFTVVSAGNPVVASFRGTIIPDSQLADRIVDDFEAGWVRVAEAYLSAASTVYKTKLNFAMAPVSGTPGPSQIYYRKEPNDTLWWAKIVSANGDSLIKRVWRREAPEGTKVPATARWRWLHNDETVWTKCDEGCCEIIG
jgi:hypothetical protein